MTKTKQYVAALLILASIDLTMYAHDTHTEWVGWLLGMGAGFAVIYAVQIMAPITVKVVKVKVPSKED